MHTKLAALVSALLLTVSLNTPAHADHDGDTIPDEFEAIGWWNVGSPTDDTPQRKWTYHKFPVTCNDSPSLPAIQVLWVTKPGQTPSIDDPTIRDQVRNDLNRATSIFAASAQTVATSDPALLTNLTPRFITWQQNNGRCYPILERVEVPAATFDTSIPAVWSYLRSIGYNSPTRKYLTLTQTHPGTQPWAGMAEFPGDLDADDKSPGNDANNGSHLLVVVRPQSITKYIAKTVAHELGHSLGAVAEGAPHRNTSNQWHPSDCLEIMCYFGLHSVPGQQNVCGYDALGNPEAYRLDCGKDDYFNTAPAPGSYLDTHFNIATESTYLWGAGNEPPFPRRPIVPGTYPVIADPEDVE